MLFDAFSVISKACRSQNVKDQLYDASFCPKFSDLSSVSEPPTSISKERGGLLSTSTNSTPPPSLPPTLWLHLLTASHICSLSSTTMTAPAPTWCLTPILIHICLTLPAAIKQYLKNENQKVLFLWLDGIADSIDVSLNKLHWKLVMDSKACFATVHGVSKSRTWCSNWTELTVPLFKY